MRLVSADFQGYKRLVDTSINLDAPVVAVVGPNEAGKTSLLDALAHIDAEGAFGPGELTRRSTPGATAAIVQTWFALEDVDRAAIAHIPESGVARWLVVSKLADGRLAHKLVPQVNRDVKPRSEAAKALSRLAQLKWALDTAFPQEGAEGERRVVAAEANAAKGLIDIEADTLDTETLGDLTSLRDGLGTLTLPPTGSRAVDAINALIASESSRHPREITNDVLRGMVPDILKFDLESRTLLSEYDLNAIDVNDPPPALDNLATLADFDLSAAVGLVKAGQYGDKLGLVEKANLRLAEVFASAWGQTKTIVRIDMDEALLRIFVSNPGGGYSSIEERSDGLRAFVALVAFTALYGGDQKPILLIDEAETHLHYDSQADLIRVLTTQTAAAKVIYTTHSAGCLPEDLGTGVRTLTPVDGADRSIVRNAFWTEGGGFSSLLLGMGASALAFASARYALIAEGGVDLMLMPTLLREATALGDLGFQVAPGLAEATPTALKQIDLSAARVAYVVDDDTAGRQIRRKLIGGGIPANRVVSLGRSASPRLVIEDTLDGRVFRDAVNLELYRSYGEGVTIRLKDITKRGRPTALEAWAKASGIKAPNRSAVARRLLEMRYDRQLLSATGRLVLLNLFDDVAAVLGIETTSSA